MELIRLLKDATASPQIVEACVRELEHHGFEQLRMEEAWKLSYEGKYYVTHHNTTLFAFTVASKEHILDGMHIGAAHTDFPCFKVKWNAQMTSEKYLKLNVEPYGGAILNTWLDRPLSVAGRVALKTENPYQPRIALIDFKRPILTIPNLAIHMNREVNQGIELNKQIDMLPLFGLEEESGEDFLAYLADSLEVDKQDILDYELTIYNCDTPQLIGKKEEFLSSPRLDNLTSVCALINAITSGGTNQTNLIALFDHEEIGSSTKQGAASLLLRDVICKGMRHLGIPEEDMISTIYKSILLSVDVAHGLHPNQPGKMDPTNQPILGKGICIKEAASQSYATDCEAVGVVMQLCRQNNIAFQKFVNRSDSRGGSTLGALASALLPMNTVDIGIPLLAMHSARELMGRKDMEALEQLLRVFML